MNQSSGTKSFGHSESGIKRSEDFRIGERFNAARDVQIAEVGVRRNFAGGDAHYAGMSWKIHSVANYCGGGIGRRGGIGENGDGVGDTKREAAAAPAAGGNPADGICTGNFERPKEGRTIG